MLRTYSLTALLTLGLSLIGCKDEELGPVLRPGNAPQITNPAPGSSFELKEADAANTMTTFTWTPAEWGFQAAVTYEVEMDQAGNGFSDPVTLGSTNTTSLAVIVEKVNTILLARELPGETPVDVEIRVVASVSPEVPALVSDPIQITIIPYTVVIDYPKLQVPGSYQGWDPANPNTVIFSVKSDNRYEGYIYFPDPNTEFKYTLGPSWTTNWGDNGADGTLDKDGANIVAGDPGVYKLNVDLNSLTHSFVKTDWGLIGSATPNGWDSDQDMTYDPATGIWSITLDLVAGEIKFRANDSWDINLGDDDLNKTLEYNGANIPIPNDGNYTIELFLHVPKYTYKITKN
ncbi:MAG: hypothetical protein KatS3mg029_0639 [Saprospiraceae bacterium]|nr:MAG: hypothetical protein KatS3mg029_0639 [Saprospiraceae bacterium]